jgi:hypothetical protein
MFRHTYNFLHVRAWSRELANAIIESFCVHARNLIEFFDQKSATPGQARSDYIGAKHFCNGYIPWTKGGPSNDLRGRLNRQISHLTYDRTERAELVRFIQRELEIFGRCLREPYKEKWPFEDDVVAASMAGRSVQAEPAKGPKCSDKNGSGLSALGISVLG